MKADNYTTAYGRKENYTTNHECQPKRFGQSGSFKPGVVLIYLMGAIILFLQLRSML